MIIVFEGTPGSGKTYDAVRKLIQNLRIGRQVYTNIDGLDQDEAKEAIKAVADIGDDQLKFRLHYLRPEQVKEFWRHCPEGSLIIIDEAHKYFNTRDWSSATNRECADWASTHRHAGNDVVFITQDIEKIDKHLRTLVEWTYRYRKINFIGSLIKNSYLVYSYVGDGDGKPITRPSSRAYEKKIFACYSSYITKDMKEQGFMTHTNILRHPVFYALPVILVIFVYFFSNSGFASGNLIPGSARAEAKIQELVSRQSESVGVAPVSPGRSTVDRSRKDRARSAVVIPVSKSIREVTARVEMAGEVVFLTRIIGSSEDEKSKMVKARDMDLACKCFSKSRIEVGYQYESI